MPLSGLERVSARPRGGVVKVELLPASKVTGAAHDPLAGCFTTFGSSEAFARYVFREDRADYSEALAGERLAPLVKHTLTMELPLGSVMHRRAAAELSARSGEGFVAVVTTAGGERLLAGYSARFGTQYPLRVAKAASASGAAPADFPSIVLTLESEDADPSLPLV